MHRAANLHQTSAIVRNYGLRAALFDANDLVLDHRGRDVRKLDREHPAEPTAFFRVTKIDELKSGDGAEKGARFVDDMQFAYYMAGGMVCHGVLIAGAEVLDLQHVDEELRKLEDPWTYRGGAGGSVRVVGEEIAVENLDHARARSGRHHDRRAGSA